MIPLFSCQPLALADHRWYHSWGDSFTKLLTFNQTAYKRVVHLDSDATVLQVGVVLPRARCGLIAHTASIKDDGRAVLPPRDSTSDASSLLVHIARPRFMYLIDGRSALRAGVQADHRRHGPDTAARYRLRHGGRQRALWRQLSRLAPSTLHASHRRIPSAAATARRVPRQRRGGLERDRRPARGQVPALFRLALPEAVDRSG